MRDAYNYSAIPNSYKIGKGEWGGDLGEDDATILFQKKQI